MTIISLSDVSAFKRCRKFWDYSSHLRESLRPTHQAPHFWLGTAVHFAIENANKSVRTTQDLFDDYFKATSAYYGRDNLPENVNDLMALGISMVENFTQSDIYKSLNIVDTELPFEVKITDNATLRGIFDAIHYDEFGNIWIIDYKTATSFANTNSLSLNEQINGYLLAAKSIFGERVAGFKYIELKKSLIKPPIILTGGQLSTNKSQSTSYGLFKSKAMEIYGSEAKIPQKYKEFMDYLLTDSYKSKFIRQTEVSIQSDAFLNEYADELRYVVTEMTNSAVQVYRTASRQCAQCPYFELCKNIGIGSDINLLLFDRTNYENRSGWEQYIEWYKGKEKRNAIQGDLREQD